MEHKPNQLGRLKEEPKGKGKYTLTDEEKARLEYDDAHKLDTPLYDLSPEEQRAIGQDEIVAAAQRFKKRNGCLPNITETASILRISYNQLVAYQERMNVPWDKLKILPGGLHIWE